VDQNHVKEQLVEQICQVSGGPCEYQGKDMKTAHMDMHVSKADFNALVEVLQETMSAEGIAFGTQNQLLARLAPLHRAVVSTDK
jgi:hemoglobin